MKTGAIAVVLLLSIVLVSSFACGSEEETVPTPTSTPTSALPTVGSFENVLLIGDFWLSPKQLPSGWSPGNRWDDASHLLQVEGFKVHSSESTSITRELLADYGIVVIGRNPPLLTDEMTLIVDWIEAGGSALFAIHSCSDCSFGDTDFNSMLLPLYGIQVNDDAVTDPIHISDSGSILGNIYTGVINEHLTTQNVSKLEFMDFQQLPSLKLSDDNTETIVQGEKDAYSEYYTSNPPLAAAAEHKGGRVIVVTGSWYHTFSDRIIEFSDNQLFFLNIINWLAHKS